MNPKRSFSAALRHIVGNVVELDQADSTHLMAQRLIDQMDDEGLNLAPTVIVAKSQSHGIGRAERTWQSAREGLYLNWIRSGLAGPIVAMLPMLAAASLRDTIEHLGIQNAVIKWPNDILISNAKVAGILVHARHSDSVWATIGIGVNLVSAPIIDQTHPTTALMDHLENPDFDDLSCHVALGFIENLHAALKAPKSALGQWRSHLVHEIGDTLSVRLASGKVETGRLLEIGEQGFLRISTHEGEKTITGGDVLE